MSVKSYIESNKDRFLEELFIRVTYLLSASCVLFLCGAW